MKIYSVGGSVRDELLNLPIQDRDYVVVGSTPEEMSRLGYRPVGKDFPVFLHPKTQEQYALARTEKKISLGYKGFKVHASPEVTLQEDLARRDLTINAIARDQNGNIIDPFNGVADLKAGLLRHVSPAFTEDPVRVLRTARFAARFGFHVAHETLALMNEMVSNGEIDTLVPERVWQEFSRGLMEKNPSRMFYLLHECKALARIMPEVDAFFGAPKSVKNHSQTGTDIHTMLAIDYAASKNYSLPVRFATLVNNLDGKLISPEKLPNFTSQEAHNIKLIKNLCERIRVPSDERNLALLVTRFCSAVHRITELDPEAVIDMLQTADAYRKPRRFEEFLQACTCDFYAQPNHIEKSYSQTVWLSKALNAANSVDSGAIATRLGEGVSNSTRLSVLIKTEVRKARIAKIKNQSA